jgi:transposase
MRYITLTEEEQQQLEDLQKTSANFVVRARCLCLLLSNKGNSMAEVSRLVNVHWHTVERLFNKWNVADGESKLLALYSAKGQGAKIKLLAVAELLPDLVEKHNRNLKPVLDILEKEHSIKVSKVTLLNFLKGARL